MKRLLAAAVFCLPWLAGPMGLAMEVRPTRAVGRSIRFIYPVAPILPARGLAAPRYRAAGSASALPSVSAPQLRPVLRSRPAPVPFSPGPSWLREEEAAWGSFDKPREAEDLPANAAANLRRLAGEIEAGNEAAPGAVFDKTSPENPPVDARQEAPPRALEPVQLPTPNLPPGTASAQAHEVRTVSDILELIPNDENSSRFEHMLVERIDKMAPYRINVYHDSRGGRFTAVDVANRSDLVDLIPELQPHETRLIHKILARTQDVQVMVRERGKTPDLIVNGVITEMKSLVGRKDAASPEMLITKANTQVREHAERHGLGHGAVALDYTDEQWVPVEQIKAEIEKFSKNAETVVLDRIYVFSKRELKLFVRQADGSYALDEEIKPLDAPGEAYFVPVPAMDRSPAVALLA